MKRRIISFVLVLALVFAAAFPAFAISTDSDASAAAAETAFQDTAQYLYTLVAQPEVSSFGGDWTVIALARSGYPAAKSWFDGYLARAEAYVVEKQGVLHQRKYTEYSRVILALTAAGASPEAIGGYDLLEKLYDFDAVTRQGINGCAYALLALDSGAYAAPEGLRQQYVEFLLERELEGGGFALSGVVADPDVSAIVLQALAPYQAQEAVSTAAERAFARLSALQQEDGSFMSYGVKCSESAAQVILALDAWGLDFNDSRFVKNGGSVTDSLLTFWRQGAGFVHTEEGDGSITIVSCEQGLLALSAIHRRNQGRGSLYTMTDVSPLFPDISGHPAQNAIETLAKQGIFSGVGDGTFRPDASLDRASFCTMTVKLLGSAPKWETLFDDVPENSWYGGYVCTACNLGIVRGTGPRQFTHSRSITRAEGAVMLYRAARALGIVSEKQDAPERSWDECLAWCMEEGLWLWETDAEQSALLQRGEAAQLLWLLMQQKEG